MGNDGGSIPTHHELVKSASRPKTHSELRDSQNQTSQHTGILCLSKRPLACHIVADHLGRLYNKDTMIEWLLKGLGAFDDGEEVLKWRGVNGLKDVVNVQFQIMEPALGDALHENSSLKQMEGGERKERWYAQLRERS